MAVGTVLVWGTGHAFLSRYQQKRQEILAACKVARDKLNPEEQKALVGKCPTPEISLVSLSAARPGDTVEVTIMGKFPAGTNFIFDSDSIEVLKESSAANSYKATIKVASGGGPETVGVAAFVPVCCKSYYRGNAFSITGNFAWELKGANGWTVKAQAASPPNEANELSYMLEFYRGTETAPFTRRRATLHPERSDPPGYYFNISGQDEASMSAQNEMAAITKQMQNPNLSPVNREKLMKRMEEVMASMTKDLKNMSDPANIKQVLQKEEEFGCTAINLKVQNGAATGNMLCSQKVGRDIRLSGTMKYLGK